MNASSSPGSAERFVGKRVRRREDARLLVGRGTFTDDVILPGMLHCAFVRSPIARGIIKSIDATIASQQPGVVAVFTAEDLTAIPAYVALSYFMTPPPFTRVYPLASGRVAYVGDPIAIVVAQDRYLAEDAAGLVEVEYEEQHPLVSISDVRTGGPIHPELPDNVAATTGEPEPDAELQAIFETAHKVVSRTITHHRTTHSPMETRAIIASPNGDHDLTVYVGCQSPQTAARQISAALNMPDRNVRVISRDVGGSFGLKGSIWREEYAVIVSSLLLRRPVKWIEDRIENLTAASQTREQECKLTVAFDENAQLLGSHMLFEQNDGAYPTTLDNNMAIPMFMWGAYKMPKYGFRTTGYHSNTVGIAPYRGPWAMESLARETLLDIAAREFGISPVEIRRRNLVKASDQPTTSVMGFPIEDIRPNECLDLLLQSIDVDAFRREQAAAREEGRLLGLGIATYIEPTVVAMPSTKSDIAQIRIEPSGAVSAVLSTHSQGHGTETTMTQVIADALGVPMEIITVHESDSSQGGYGIGAGGSRQAITGGGASIRASKILVEKIKAIAAHLSNAHVDQVHIVDGVVRIEGVPEMDRSLAEIANIAYSESERLPPGMEAGLEAHYRYEPPPITYASAAHAAIVEVDRTTGFVSIARWVCVEDCGVLINPAVVEGQIAGGLAQGIGTVLMEEFVYDNEGNPTTVTFKDYILPAISDIPDFEYHHLCTPSQTEGGFRGVGEGGAIIGPPTLVNAIADALEPLGVECLTLPLSPNHLFNLMEQAEGR